MSFMQPQITDALDWVYVDTTQGGFFFLSDEVGEVPEEDWDAKVWAANRTDLDPKDIFGVGMNYGCGARMSAPGYLDCTDWTVHDSAEEAAKYLLDNYYDMSQEEMTPSQLEEWAGLCEIAERKP